MENNLFQKQQHDIGILLLVKLCIWKTQLILCHCHSKFPFVSTMASTKLYEILIVNTIVCLLALKQMF